MTYIYIFNIITKYKNKTNKGLWGTVKDLIHNLEEKDLDITTLTEICDLLNILAQHPDSKEIRQLETEIGLQILNSIY